jgi:hypothetical protein
MRTDDNGADRGSVIAVRTEQFVIDVPRRRDADQPRLEPLHEEQERSHQDRHDEHDQDHAHLLAETLTRRSGRGISRCGGPMVEARAYLAGVGGLG